MIILSINNINLCTFRIVISKVCLLTKQRKYLPASRNVLAKAITNDDQMKKPASNQ